MNTEPPVTQGGQTPAADERPARRRRRQLSVVAVAAAVLLAGGGGAYWTSTSGSSDDGAGQDSASESPKLALDGLAAGQSSGGDGEDQAGIAPGEPHGGQIYQANKKLPDGPEAASVYRTPTAVSRESVAGLARSLGVKGTPEKKDGRWRVGEDDERRGGPSLTVNGDRLAGNWTYQTEDSPVMPCGKPLPTVPRGDAVAPGPGGKPGSCPAVPGSGKGDPVSEAKAKSAVEPALKTLRQKDAQLDAGVTTGSLRMVTATPKVDGMPTRDWNSTFTVNEDGRVVRGHGNLGELRKGASYPVMTAKETLADLNKQGATGTHSGSGTVREPAPDTASGSTADGTADSTADGATEQAPGKAAPRKPLKVTDAEFGLVTRYTFGKPVLVPSWIYTVELRGGEHTASVAHPAVQPEYLKPTRSSQPGTGSGSEPGTGSGSGQAGTPSSSPLQAVNSYEADGRTLKLTFWGGVCGGYKADAEETAKSVEVTVRPKETDSKKVCVKMAKRQTVEIELDKALGDRKVLDAQDGEGVPRAG